MSEQSYQLKVERTIPVSADKLFDAWLDPESIKVWMCPGEGVTVPNPVIEAKVGGQYDFTMAMGEKVIPHSGEYKLIDRPSRLQFTWVSPNTKQLESLVTINFESLSATETKLTLVHELLPSEESKNDHLGGWTRIVECLSGHLS